MCEPVAGLCAAVVSGLGAAVVLLLPCSTDGSLKPLGKLPMASFWSIGRSRPPAGRLLIWYVK